MPLYFTACDDGSNNSFECDFCDQQLIPDGIPAGTKSRFRFKRTTSCYYYGEPPGLSIDESNELYGFHTERYRQWEAVREYYAPAQGECGGCSAAGGGVWGYAGCCKYRSYHYTRSRNELGQCQTESDNEILNCVECQYTSSDFGNQFYESDTTYSDPVTTVDELEEIPFSGWRDTSDWYSRMIPQQDISRRVAMTYWQNYYTQDSYFQQQQAYAAVSIGPYLNPNKRYTWELGITEWRGGDTPDRYQYWTPSGPTQYVTGFFTTNGDGIINSGGFHNGKDNFNYSGDLPNPDETGGQNVWVELPMVVGRMYRQSSSAYFMEDI
jgi:hypothetical protein